jgi:hypothetical protein
MWDVGFLVRRARTDLAHGALDHPARLLVGLAADAVEAGLSVAAAEEAEGGDGGHGGGGGLVLVGVLVGVCVVVVVVGGYR